MECSMTVELTLTGARVVLADTVIVGTVHIVDGLIDDIASGQCAVPGRVDLQGGLLLPGLVDLHADSLEQHILPRPGVRWHPLSAILAHDSQAIAAGITTVLVSPHIGSGSRSSDRLERSAIVPVMVEGIRTARSLNLLQADHLLHLRCEVTDGQVLELLEPFTSEPLVKLISVMDHAPGHRQSPHLDRFRELQIERFGWTTEDAERQMRAWIDDALTIGPKNQDEIVAFAHAKGIPIASHDDQTEEHVRAAHRSGITIAEFPTTRLAAETARALGMRIVMGAPNVVQGGSYYGNVSATDLASTGHVDVLVSDYLPASLLHGAMLLSRDPVGMSLTKAMASVTTVPTALCNLLDRGRIAVGLRADLIHVVETHGVPVVKDVWSKGRHMYAR
jgi:alpha-D-ribose 1-methylphosphonate 5-triphosphate diphosphatase